MLTALSMSAAVAHLLEMPAKLNYDGALWLNLLQTLYPTFGKVSGVCEIGAVIACLVLIVAVRKRRERFVGHCSPHLVLSQLTQSSGFGSLQ
ncbi:hypothetical protein D3C73_1551900 [compost metagenome]